ncbi:hypothetical protein O3P69_016847 [Scylla paramamosain]|uniref:Uncharacterized protein n=1 Tax=Scylla paramamosain TaxID=85552 RepID=A0AAW0SZS0_SCYPA
MNHWLHHGESTVRLKYSIDFHSTPEHLPPDGYGLGCLQSHTCNRTKTRKREQRPSGSVRSVRSPDTSTLSLAFGNRKSRHVGRVSTSGHGTDFGFVLESC